MRFKLPPSKTGKADKNLCPVCNGKWYKIQWSELICAIHEQWFVTKCQICGKRAFSDIRGYCPSCLEKSPPIQSPSGFNSTHRGLLRHYGQEGDR